MKFPSLTSALALTLAATASVSAIPSASTKTTKGCPSGSGPSVPYTTVAGIKVIDTPLVRKARALVEANFEPPLVRHMYRSWLFGAAAINNNATLAAEVDLEAQAVGTILHDLGWDQRPNSPWRSR